MVKLHLKRLCALFIGIISLIGCIFYSQLLEAPGIDYTTSYELYNDIRELSQVKDVESYLDNKNISYEIDENRLTVPDYDTIEYIINPDNETGYIVHSTLIHNLSKLDERNLDIIYVKKDIIDGQTLETICLDKNGFIYTKIDNKYYVEPTLIYLIHVIVFFLSSIIILPLIIIEYIGIFFDYLKKRKDRKTVNNEFSTTDSNKINWKNYFNIYIYI